MPMLTQATVEVEQARALRRFLESRGPLFVRLGQFLAMRPDRLPEAYGRELLLLEENAPPMPTDEVRRLLDEECGRGGISAASLGELTELDPRPIRSTLLCQSHAARWRGEAVAVKLRRPGAERWVAEELQPERVAGELIRAGVLRGESLLAAAVEELREELHRSLDLSVELLNLQNLRQAESARLTVPRPVPEMSSERVLTRALQPGLRLTRLLRPPATEPSASEPELDARQPDRGAVARSLVEATLDEIFGVGLMNRFWHPDNILALTDGAVSLRDHQRVGAIGEDAQAWYLRLFNATLEGDPVDLFQTLRRELDLEPAREEALRRRFIAASREWDLGKRLREVTLSGDRRWPTRTLKRLRGMMALLESEQAVPAGEFAAVQRRLAGVEAICWNLAPKADLRSHAGEPLSRLALERSVRRLRSTDIRPLLAAFSFVRRLPESLGRILQELADGKFSVYLSTTESEKTRRDRDQRTWLLVGALATIGLAALVAAPEPLTLFGVSLRGPLAAVLGGLYLWLLIEGVRRR